MISSRRSLCGRHAYDSVSSPLLRWEFIRLLAGQLVCKPLGTLHWSHEDRVGWMHDHFADSVLLADEESETETPEGAKLLTIEGLEAKAQDEGGLFK
jgi:hypothetical protein